jgi:hypothetical protein
MAEPEPDNSIADDHKRGIHDFISEEVPSGDFVEMIEFMFNNWLLIIDRDLMVGGATRRRLGVLTVERDRQDDQRQALDDEIAQLEGQRP